MSDFTLFEKALSEYNKTKGEIEHQEKKNRESFDDDVDEEEDYGDSNDVDTLINFLSTNNNNINTIVKEKNEDKFDLSKCLHENCFEELGMVVCSDCGQEIQKNVFSDKEWRYYGPSDNKRASDPNRVHLRKLEERNIFKDVENMGFSEKIVSIANDLYLQVTNGKIFRGNSRKGIIFACIFHSFKINQTPQTEDKLIKLFDLSKKNGLKGIKFVNLNLPNNSLINTTYITPIHLIDDIMEKFNATDKQKTEVIKLYEQIKNKSSKINRSRPQSISAGLIYFWIRVKGIDIELKDFATKIELSELTISKITKEIANVLDVPLSII